MHQKELNASRPPQIAEKLGQKKALICWCLITILYLRFPFPLLSSTDCVHRVILNAHFWTYGIKYLGMCHGNWSNIMWYKLRKAILCIPKQIYVRLTVNESVMNTHQNLTLNQKWTFLMITSTQNNLYYCYTQSVSESDRCVLGCFSLSSLYLLFPWEGWGQTASLQFVLYQMKNLPAKRVDAGGGGRGRVEQATGERVHRKGTNQSKQWGGVKEHF